MRKALNDNPLAQIAVIAVLALAVGFVLITQVAHKSSGSSGTTATASSLSTGSANAATAAGAADTATPSSSTAPIPSGSAAPSSSAAAGTAAAPSTGSGSGGFVAGPGLPPAVVKAYRDNKVVVLLVVRRNGIDDAAVKASVKEVNGGADKLDVLKRAVRVITDSVPNGPRKQAGIGNKALKGSLHRLGYLKKLALFVTNAGHIDHYARIAEGVNLDRVPALIILRPKGLTHDGMPVASVSYGFRGADGVLQAILDAVYRGPKNLPYYPK